MNLEARKISFVQEFLKLENEQIIDGLEKFLYKQKAELLESNLKPMSLEQFNFEIDQSLNDVENGCVTEAKTLKGKVADLAGTEDIQIEHLAEAIQFRSLDREGWAG